MPLAVGAALLASADGYTPRANASLDRAREEIGAIEDIANALADNLPAPKLTARKSRRRRRKRKTPATGEAPVADITSETADTQAPTDVVSLAPVASTEEPVAPEPSEDAA
jgi:hypothetical protein